VARFLAQALGGPLAPEEAARVAAAVPATRVPDRQATFSAVEAEPGGIRSLARLARRIGPPGSPARGGLPDEEPLTPDEPWDPLTGPTSPAPGGA
jgi:hypothetical protein